MSVLSRCVAPCLVENVQIHTISMTSHVYLFKFALTSSPLGLFILYDANEPNIQNS